MYYLIYFSLVALACINLIFTGKKAKLFYATSFCILLIFAGLRYNVGYDYDNYEEMYNLIFLKEENFIEPLFFLFIKVVQFFNLNYAAFIFIIAFVSIAIKYKFLIKYSVYPLLSILIYYSRIYLNTDFGQLRQGLALGIVLFTYPYIIDRKFYKFLMLIIAASLIHAAAFLFLPIYFLAHKKFNKKIIVSTIFVSLIIATIDLKDVLLNLFESVLPEGLAFKLFYYSKTEESLGITFSVVLRLLIILFAIVFYWKEIQKNNNFRIIFNIYYIGYLFYLIFNSLPQLGGRGSIYFQQFELLLLPLLLLYAKNKLIKLLFFAFLIFYTLWGVITILNSVTYETSYHFEPYESILTIF